MSDVIPVNIVLEDVPLCKESSLVADEAKIRITRLAIKRSLIFENTYMFLCKGLMLPKSHKCVWSARHRSTKALSGPTHCRSKHQSAWKVQRRHSAYSGYVFIDIISSFKCGQHHRRRNVRSWCGFATIEYRQCITFEQR